MCSFHWYQQILFVCVLPSGGQRSMSSVPSASFHSPCPSETRSLTGTNANSQVSWTWRQQAAQHWGPRHMPPTWFHTDAREAGHAAHAVRPLAGCLPALNTEGKPVKNVIEILPWKLKNRCGNLLWLRVYQSWDESLSLLVWGLSWFLCLSQPKRGLQVQSMAMKCGSVGIWCWHCSFACLFPLCFLYLYLLGKPCIYYNDISIHLKVNVSHRITHLIE